MFDRKQEAILGLCVADAVGVPVEFEPRSKRKEDPVIDMRAFGTHHQPAVATIEDASVIEDLLYTLKANEAHCVGLAANMIGIQKKIIVYSLGSFGVLMVNPVIITKSKPYEFNDTCYHTIFL